MLKEDKIRQILNQFKTERDFHLKTKTNDELNTIFKTEWEVLNQKIILLETILEESMWQRLMNNHKKENVFIRRFDIMCDYLFRTIK